MSKIGKIQKINNFIPGEYVVLPAHGVGKFMEYSCIESSVGSQYFYKIKFELQNMDVMIPESNFLNSGLRKIASKEAVEKVFDIIAKVPRNQRGIWNKRMQEYDAKIYSGVLSNLAEVMRDGFICSIDQNKSYTERAKYKTALHRVCQEISAVLEESYEDVERKMISILKSKQNKGEEMADEFDADFEDMGDISESEEKRVLEKSNFDN